MASLLSHPAGPLSLFLGSGQRPHRKIILTCIALSLLPDADVIAFAFGIPYESQWGHRGFTHSLVFALGCGLLCSLVFKENKKNIFLLTTLSTFSHPLFDMLTNGGLGVALWWPFDTGRYFFPWRPVEVSPIGIGNFIGLRGVRVLVSEFLILWLPLLSLGYLTKRLRQ